MKEKLQNIVDRYGIRMRVEELVEKIYRELGNEDDMYIINDRYLHVAGIDYHFTKSVKNHCWIVKEF